MDLADPQGQPEPAVGAHRYALRVPRTRNPDTAVMSAVAVNVPAEGGAGPEHTQQLPAVTVIVPTRNEAGNVEPLVACLEACLSRHRAEVLFVDDSTDDTPDVVTFVAASAAIPVRLLHRAEGERTGGLGGAVQAGLDCVTTPWAVVMDGDLQHPPELVPVLVAAGVSNDADIVIGSRYLPSGSNDGLAGARRVAVSRSAGWVTRVLFPRRLKGVTDSLSGLFALRMDAVRGVNLRAHGFKILLEILARTPDLRITEIPFSFGERGSGESKASMREGLRFIRHLFRLRLSILAHARLGRAAVFGVVGLSGIAINALAFWLSAAAGLHYLVAAIVATQASTLWNFFGTDSVVFQGAKRRPFYVRLVSFAAMNEVILVARLPLIAFLVTTIGVPALLANVATLLLTFFLRFAFSERLFLSEAAS